MNYTYSFILLIGYFFISFYSYSQTQPIFQKIDQSQGLSSSRITGIVKEKDGFVWISTQYGLNRYDGHSFKVYTKQNSNLPTNDISGLYLDRENRLWITTLGRGLSLYDEQNDSFITYKQDDTKPNAILSNRINTIVEDNSGSLWIGSEKGLTVFKAEQNEFFNYSFSQPNPLNIKSLLEDSQARLWVGTASSGIFLFNKQTKEFVEVQKNPSVSINDIVELNSDEILFATSGQGLLKLQVNQNLLSKFLSHKKEFTDKTKIVRSIKKDRFGTLWIGSDGYGLFEIQDWITKSASIKNYMQNTQQSYALSGNAIYALTEDENANLWIGTAWNGINVLDSKRQTEIIFSDFKGIDDSPVLSIFQNEQYLILGLDGSGLSVFDKIKQQAYFFDEQKIQAKYVQKIMQSKDGTMWLGTFNNGLLKFDLKTKKVKKYIHNENDENSISFNDVRDIIEDEQNNLWISTWGGGLNYLNTKTEEFTTYDLQHKNLISIVKEGNKLWTTSYGGGLRVLNTKSGKLEAFLFDENDKNTVSSNNILSLLKDSNGYLWIGTAGEGINRMDMKNNQIERFETNENISYKTITSIIEGADNNIWFGTKDGIIKYDYSRESFSFSSNLSGDYHINSVAKDHNGFLYFGGIKGVIKFNPKHLKKTNPNPKVVITNFKIFNKETNQKNSETNFNLSSRELTLKHHQDVITFEFAALKYPFSSNCEYAIQMENFDEDWRYIGKDRTVTYTNLYPGEYTFKVKSSIVGSPWDDEFTSIKVKILKPFWITWWAYLFYGILVLFFLYLYRRITLKWASLKNNLALEKLAHQKDKEFYNLKQQFFTTISHEIRTPVTLILSSINRLFNSDELQNTKQFKAAHTIRRNSNLLLRLINELLDVKKLESKEIVLNATENNIVGFTKDVFLSFTDVAKDRNINYKFKSNVEKQTLWFDKAQLEKVIFNLLSNAFKFTKDKGNIYVEVVNHSDHVSILIKDDGIGISSEHLNRIFSKYYQVKGQVSYKGFGLGLSIAKDIVDLHKGKINVVSELNQGSLFEVTLFKNNAIPKANEKTTEHSKNGNPNDTGLKQKLKVSKKKNLSVLIVEDNIELQEALNDIFQDKNYDVLLANNGLEGLKKATLNLPDIIVSDLMMPEMDGLEMAKKIKTNSITSHIPIIILTAKTSIQDQLEGYQTGADEYITKPYNETFLLQRVKNLIDNRKKLSAIYSNQNLSHVKETIIDSQEQVFLEKLYKLFEEHLQSETLKAEFIAKKMNMSHSALYKKIKTLTGLTYMQLVRDYKLSIAKQLIEDMGYSVSEASYKVGYSDTKYFSKLFKKKFKKNPSEFISS